MHVNLATKTILATLLVFLSAGCRQEVAAVGAAVNLAPQVSPYRADPPAALPESLRQKNWIGSQGEGSCHHAAFCDVLRRQDMPEMAGWWRRHNGNGSHTASLVAKAERVGIKMAFTKDGDVKFLDWCTRTGRSAAVYWPGSSELHAITFNGFNGPWAYVTDNNSPSRQVRMTKTEFLRKWRSVGGHALTVMHTPIAPKPWIQGRSR
jgi:hypothetical protein